MYCILSKETARNGYMRKPSVKWNRIKRDFECSHCGYVQEMDVLVYGSRYTVKAHAGFFLNENSKNHKCQNKKCQKFYGLSKVIGISGSSIRTQSYL